MIIDTNPDTLIPSSSDSASISSNAGASGFVISSAMFDDNNYIQMIEGNNVRKVGLKLDSSVKNVKNYSNFKGKGKFLDVII